MSEIKIFPIFDQSAPGVWDDFLRIRIAAMSHNYDYGLSPQEISQARTEYVTEFNRRAYSFAFGAFQDTEMVGYIRGSGIRSTAEIKCLYVLPSHQGQHIGRRLLTMAESSVAPTYNNVELISLGHAESFYKQHKYKSKYGTNTYIKKLELPHCCDVPLFGYTARISRLCQHLSPTMDMSALVAPHAPVFAHFDGRGDVDGILIVNPETNKPVLFQTKTNNPNEWVYKSLTGTLSRYCSGVSLMHPHHSR